MHLAMPDLEPAVITEVSPKCPLCDTAGANLYERLRDLVFGTSGEWTLQKCVQSDCQLVWLNPRPRPDQIQKAYLSYYTHAEGSLRGGFSARNVLRSIYQCIKNGYLRCRLHYRSGVGSAWCRLVSPLAYFHPAGVDAVLVDAMFLEAPPEGGKLLEIGCGDGLLLERMHRRGWNVQGVEFDPKCVELVQKRGLLCQLGDLRELHLPSDAFDAIYMGNVIEHVYDPRSFLQECFRLLRSSGRLLVLTPNSKSWGHKHYRQDWRGLEPPRHLQIFDPGSLLRLSKESGFIECEVRTTNRGAWYIIGMSRAIQSARLAGHSRSSGVVSLISFSGLVDEFWGRIVHLFAPALGEELILKGCKR